MIGSVVRTTPELVKPGNTAGLEFLDEAERIKRESAKLRAQGVRVQVVVIHEGATLGANAIDGRPAAPWEGPIVRIVEKLQDTTVDLVVAGHTHRAANTVIGRIPVVEGFNAGISYSVAQLLVDDGDVQWAGAATRLAKNIGVAQRADVKAIVDKASADTAPLRNVVIGSQTGSITRDNPARLKESSMGNFVTDAMRAKYAQDDGVQVAMTNSGGLRADLVDAPPPGGEPITWGEAFAVLPFGNSTVIETLTYEQLVAALASGFASAVRDSAGGDRAHPAVLRHVGEVALQRHRAGDRQRLARAARPGADHGAAGPGQHRPDRHQRLHVRRWRRLHGAGGRHERPADGRSAAGRGDRPHQGQLAGLGGRRPPPVGHGSAVRS